MQEYFKYAWVIKSCIQGIKKMSLFLKSTFLCNDLSYYCIWKAWDCCVLWEHFLKYVLLKTVFYMRAVFVKNARVTALENELPMSLNSYTRNHNKACNWLAMFKGMLTGSVAMTMLLCTASSVTADEIVFSWHNYWSTWYLIKMIKIFHGSP